MSFFKLYRLYRKFSAREQKVFVLLICLGIVGLAGLLGNLYKSTTHASPAYGGTITEGVVGFPTNFNPLKPPAGDADQDVRSLVQAGLLSIDKNGNYQPLLAEGLPEVSSDLKTYTIKLKPGLMWQDGLPITADDVVYTFKTVADKNTGSYLRTSYRFVQADKVDDLTVRFTLRDPSATFMENLLIDLLPQHIDDYNDLKPIGAGPYKIKNLKYNAAGQISEVNLEAFTDFQPHQPYITNFDLKFFASGDELASAYKKHQIDNFGFIPSFDYQRLGSETRLLQINQPEYQTVFFNLGQETSILSDLKVRQALVVGTNRQDIVQSVYKNTADPIGGPAFGANQVPPPNYDPQIAKQLLQDDGWVPGQDGIRVKNNQPLEFTLWTNTASTNTSVAASLQKQWADLGVKLDIQTLNNTDLFAQIISPRKYDALLISENSGHDPDPYAFWHSSQATDPGLNFSELRSNTVDQVIIQARATADPQARNDLYVKFADLLNQSSPAVFLAQPDYLYAVNRNIQSLEINRLDLPAERFTSVWDWYIEVHRSFKK